MKQFTVNIFVAVRFTTKQASDLLFVQDIQTRSQRLVTLTTCASGRVYHTQSVAGKTEL